MASSRNTSGWAPPITIWFRTPTWTIAAARTMIPSRPHVRIVMVTPASLTWAVGPPAPFGALSSWREPLEHGHVLENQEVDERGHEDL